MSWLDRIDEREARRIAHKLGQRARATGALARGHLGAFLHEASDLAVDTLQPRRLAETVGRNARATGELAREHLSAFAHDAGDLATDTAQQLARYGRQEGAVLAAAATRQAGRASRAVKADPVPYIVGAVGLVLLANLVASRRARR
jgi:hypothetical protein